MDAGLAASSWPMPVADPATGEILFDAGPRPEPGASAEQLDAVGVAEVSVELDSGETIRVFSNRMCDMSRYVDFDPKAELRHQGAGALRRAAGAAGPVQRRGADGASAGSTPDDLVPKHIIVDDILASINYMNGLAHGTRRQGRHRPSGQPPPALRGRAAAEPVPHRL